MVLRGLLPGFGPVATASASVPRSDEPTVMAAPAPDEECANPEHACGVTLHLCGCCASQPVVLPALAGLCDLVAAPSRVLDVKHLLAHREPDRPFRPPIR